MSEFEWNYSKRLCKSRISCLLEALRSSSSLGNNQDLKNGLVVFWMHCKFHYLPQNTVLIVLIVSTQTGQHALASAPALLSTANGTITLFFPVYRMWLHPATAFTQQKKIVFCCASISLFSSLSDFILKFKIKSINSVYIRAHFLPHPIHSQNWPPKNLKGGRSRIIFLLLI